MQPVLSRGSTGPYVEAVQAFLRGTGHYLGAVDGHYGPATVVAVAAWQDTLGGQVRPDGVVGPRTWGALVAAGIPLDEREDGEDWPPQEHTPRTLTTAEMHDRFGVLVATPDPQPGNPEAVRLSHPPPLERVVIPALEDLRGGPRGGLVLLHRDAAAPFRALVAAWQAEGVWSLVRSWGGSYAPRYVRGSRTTLSRHSWGTAFDVNAAWNGLGRVPALRDAPGSVRGLVPAAERLGWVWGGRWSRPDGMHFELGG